MKLRSALPPSSPCMRAIVAAFVTLSFAVVIAMLCSSKASAQTCKGVSGQTQSDICYAGGNVLRGATIAYVIYYGSWNSSTQVIINNWLANIGGTGLFGINTQYPDFTGGAVQNVVNYNGVTNSYQDYQNPGDDYQTLGTQLNGDAAVQTIVSDAISSGHFPADQSGVYFVLTDPNVTQINGPFAGTFCTDYIAYHYASTSIVSGYNIKYALVGNVSQCPHNYDPNIYSGDTTTPNGDVAADGDINLIFHELSEAVTDPWIGSWGATSSQVYEVGDLCEGTSAHGASFLSAPMARTTT